MSTALIPAQVRYGDYFHHIDMGFINRRLCLSALPREVRTIYIQTAKPGSDHMTVLGNDHLLVTTILDVCEAVSAPTLLQALALGKPRCLFRSTERFAPCPDVYTERRVTQDIILDIAFEKPVCVAYHTEYIVSSTGRMTLAEGIEGDHVESVIGVLHDKGKFFEVEPLVMGAPWLDHPRNGRDTSELIWHGRDHGELLPEDIEQFARLTEVVPESSDDWMNVMRSMPEEKVKEAFTSLLAEPAKKDWGGETNDHFSASISVTGRRRTAAFLLKGPTNFREMTLDMCGKRADQIHRLVGSGAEISVVQHSHLIGEVVRTTLRALTVYPGWATKYCLIDGQATFRILRAHGFA